LNNALKASCETILETSILNYQSVVGGDINEAFALQTQKGTFFLKFNTNAFAKRMFEVEALGLKHLAKAQVITIPKVIANGSVNGIGYLLLEYISTQNPAANFWENFGTTLAQMHQQSAVYFGLDHDNFIGRLSQSNQQHSNWVSFYESERIRPQLAFAERRKLIVPALKGKFETLFKKWNSIFPEEPPALIHGDLWNGNYIIGQNGKVVLIDPAISYAHRELDLAMTKLFGGFSPTFYKAYHNSYPLQTGWEERMDIYQLYFLLVHVNLFGGSYLPSVKRIVEKYVI